MTCKDEDKIICAAIKPSSDGPVYVGARHHHAIVSFVLTTGVSYNSSMIDGFITADGRFLNRKEAFTLAIQTNQTLKDIRGRKDTDLYSEDLW